ncbi:hypothetical protein N824_24955 [Pedobacter sp. V48]|nr:hypothetical protein N824_24955 [Pedobacter sp. V48]
MVKEQVKKGLIYHAMSSNLSVKRICEYCGNTFTAKTTVTRFLQPKVQQQKWKAKAS